MPLFADLLLPIKVNQLFTYLVPEKYEEMVKEGQRVIVQFGPKKIQTGLIWKTHQNKPERYIPKEIIQVLDTEPVVTKNLTDLFEWVAGYYLCTLGEVMNASLPAALRLNSESKISLFEGVTDLDAIDLTEKEKILSKAIAEKGSITFHEAEKIMDLKSVHGLINKLVEKKVITVFEELEEKFHPKLIRKIRLRNEIIEKKNELEKVLTSLEKKSLMQDAVLKYLQRIQEADLGFSLEKNKAGVLKSEFIESGVSESSIKSLVKKKIFEIFDEEVSRFGDIRLPEKPEITELNVEQNDAFIKIKEYFKKSDTVLLHGITGSGKTEIYIHLIREYLSRGKQILYILPEIALTHQIVNRIRKGLGVPVGIYHSRFTDNERAELWHDLVKKKFQVILGVRSAVLLPFDDLGLIVIDEEHDSSYKQNEPDPKYHARDTSLMMAQIHKAKVLLGSATPSLESYYNATTGKWGLVELTQRYGTAQLPVIQLVDMKKERKWKRLKGHFSSNLFQELQECLTRNEQAILFQNRKGYSPYLSCATCFWIMKCRNCNVNLTYYLGTHVSKCHYCGYTVPPATVCPDCGNNNIKLNSFGTEKLEDELHLLLPEAKVQRMDLDTTRGKTAYQEILDDFGSGRTQILVGTQMVTKGLDFENVSLIGIMDADQMLNYPDFRSHERSFQLMEQVSGRAGRREKLGKVLIQCKDPQHPILNFVYYHDYKQMYEYELELRKKFLYPPFTRLIQFTLKHADPNYLSNGTNLLVKNLKVSLGATRVVGPETPFVNKIRNKYILNLIIKLERQGIDLKKCKKIITEILNDHRMRAGFKGIYVVVDVDPG